ncbi:oocyte zinc finger protein XlCOF19 [Anabrus simplex]|uniref:oocyte zinc finger protein XlCOF19 n=1 Tax=Anabrus simplex TaxID=316456 RepID=UPI0034DD46AB
MESKAVVKFESVWLPEDGAGEESCEKDTEIDAISVKTEPMPQDPVLMDDKHLNEPGPEPVAVKQVTDKRSSVNSSNGELRQHNGPYSCEVCDAVFQKLNDIAEHIESFCGKRPYKCKQCGRRVSDLSNHKHRNTVKEALFNCDICPRTFVYRGTLARHERTHNAKPHKCEFCGRTFHTRSGLVCHSRTHEGQQYE